MSAAAKFHTQIVISAVNRSQQAFAGINAQIDKTSERLNRIGTQMQLAGFRATAAMGFPAQRMISGIMSAGEQLSEAQNDLESVIYQSVRERGGDVEEMMDRLALKAKEVSIDTKFTNVETTAAQTYLGRAGLGGEQVLGATRATVETAVALSMEAQRASDKLSNTILGFGLMDSGETDLEKIEEAFRRVSDVASFTAANSNVDGEQFFESMKSLGPLSVGVGKDIEYMASMVSVLGDKGIQGAEAGVALRSSIARMLAPTKQVRAAFADLNIDMDKFTTLKKDPITADLVTSVVGSGVLTEQQLAGLSGSIDGALAQTEISVGQRMRNVQQIIADGLGLKGEDAQKVGDALGNYQASLMEDFDFTAFAKQLSDQNPTTGQLGVIFGKYHFTKIMAMMQDIDSVNEMYERLISSSSGSASEMASIKMKDMSGAMNRMRNAWELVKTSFQEGAAGDFLIGIINRVTSLMLAFANLSPEVKKVILILSGFAVVGGPLLIYIGLVAQGLGALMIAARGLGGAFLMLPKHLLAPVMMLGRLHKALPIAAFAALTAYAVKLGPALSTMMVAGPIAALAASGSALGRVLATMTDTGGKYGQHLSVLGGRFKFLTQSVWGYIKAFGEVNPDKRAEAVRRATLILKYAFENLKQTVSALWSGLKTEFMSEVFGKDAQRAADAFSGLWRNLKKIGSNIVEMIVWVVERVGQSLGLLTDTISGNTAAEKIVSIVEALERVTRPLADGSRAKGILAMAGAFYVLNKALRAVSGAGVMMHLGVMLAGLLKKGFKAGLLTMIPGVMADGSSKGRLARIFGQLGRGAAAVFVASFATAKGLARILTGFTGATVHATFRVAGTMAGMVFSGAFRAAALLGMVGGKMSAAIGGTFVGRIGKAAGRWGLAALKLIGKGLLRAVPVIGWALLAYEVGSMIWHFFGDEITRVAKKVGSWFAEKMNQALSLIGLDLSDVQAAMSRFVQVHVDAFGLIVEKAKAFKAAPLETGKEIAIALGDGIVASMTSLGKSIYDALVAAFDFVMENVNDLTDKFKSIGTAIADAIMAPLAAVGEKIHGMLAAVKSLLGFGGDGEEPAAGQPGYVPGADPLATARAPIPLSPIKLNPIETPMTFQESGTEVSTGSGEEAKLMADTLGWLKENGVTVNTEGKVDLTIRTQPGVTASGVATSGGDVPIRLNAGTGKLAVP